MPVALSTMQTMLTAKTAWQYWSAFARGVRELNDWHTAFRSGLDSVASSRHFGACFIEGKADLTQGVWPSQAGWADVLVSHVGSDDNHLGLVPGDRLVAVDGVHPLEWARSLRPVNFRDHAATDADVDAEYAEGLASSIASFAKTISVIRCDAATLACNGTIETIPVTELPDTGQTPSCDNRPLYHLKNPPAGIGAHHVPFVPWRDELVDSQPGEKIYGMTFDNLYGTSQGLTPFFADSNQFFRDNARGVILDHRAGNGGTLDAPEEITDGRGAQRSGEARGDHALAQRQATPEHEEEQRRGRHEPEAAELDQREDHDLPEGRPRVVGIHDDEARHADGGRRREQRRE